LHDIHPTTILPLQYVYPVVDTNLRRTRGRRLHQSKSGNQVVVQENPWKPIIPLLDALRSTVTLAHALQFSTTNADVIQCQL